jgi:hypothetical protein
MLHFSPNTFAWVDGSKREMLLAHPSAHLLLLNARAGERRICSLLYFDPAGNLNPLKRIRTPGWIDCFSDHGRQEP